MTTRNQKSLLTLVVLGTLVSSAGSALGAPIEDCNHPRNAADSVFYWLQPKRADAEKASMCLDKTDRTPFELERAAVRIKAVYDANALYVDMERLSTSPDWVNPKTGNHRVAPHPDLPQVVIEKQADGRWRWTQASLDRIDALYSQSVGFFTDRVLDRLPGWMRTDFLQVEFWQLLSIFLILLLGLVVRKVIQFLVAARVRNLVENLGQAWAARIVDVFASPGATLVMAAMLQLSYPYLRLPIFFANGVSLAVRLLVVLSIVWATYRLVDVFAERMAEKAAKTDSKLDDQLVPLLRKALKIFTVIGGGLFILQNLNVNVGSLLAGLGIGGVAVALAAKDTIANFFGSVMIFVDRPFQIGDWVAISGVEGIVEEVGFRSTRIRTFYNSQVTVPNAKFTEANIDNFGRREYRRTYTTLNLTYDTTTEQMQAFVEGIRAIIRANQYTRKDYYEIHMSGFGAHSLDVMVYFFFKVSSWSEELRERHNVFLEIMRLAEKLGVSFAFPTQTLYVDKVASPGAARVRPSAPSMPQLTEAVKSFGPAGEQARPTGPRITDGYFATKD